MANGSGERSSVRPRPPGAHPLIPGTPAGVPIPIRRGAFSRQHRFCTAASSCESQRKLPPPQVREEGSARAAARRSAKAAGLRLVPATIFRSRFSSAISRADGTGNAVRCTAGDASPDRWKANRGQRFRGRKRPLNREPDAARSPYLSPRLPRGASRGSRRVSVFKWRGRDTGPGKRQKRAVESDEDKKGPRNRILKPNHITNPFEC